VSVRRTERIKTPQTVLLSLAGLPDLTGTSIPVLIVAQFLESCEPFRHLSGCAP